MADLCICSKNIQLDLEGGIGLSRVSPDYFIATGISVRFLELIIRIIHPIKIKNMKSKFITKGNKIAVLILITGMFVGLSQFIFLNNVNRTNLTYSQFTRYSDELKFAIALSHLWMEEYMSGDETVDFEKEIKEPIAEKIEVLKIIIEEGKLGEEEFDSNSDKELRFKLNSILLHLKEFQKSIENRHEFKIALETQKDPQLLLKLKNSIQEVDQAFDGQFAKLIGSVDELNNYLRSNFKSKSDNLAEFKNYMLLGVLLISIIVGIFLKKTQDTNEEYSHSAMLKIESEQIRMSKISQTFINSISQGIFSSKLNLETDDTLGSILKERKPDLQIMEAKQNQRIWEETGISEAGVILRASKNLPEACHQSLKNLLVKCNGINGAIYLFNDDDPKDEHFKLIASFAQDAPVSAHNRIDKGQA